MRFEFLSSAAVFAAVVSVADAVKGNADTLLRREVPEPVPQADRNASPHERREKIERQARWAERLEKHEVPSSVHDRAGEGNMITYVDELQTLADPASLDPRFRENGPQHECLQDLMKNNADFSKDKVCSEAATNEIKDDHGNFIRYTIREDKAAIKIWDKVMEDCQKGSDVYLRDMVEGFGMGVSCFEESASQNCSQGAGVECDKAVMDDKAKWYTAGKTIDKGTGNRVKAGEEGQKRICEAKEKLTPGTLEDYQKELLALVQDYDTELEKPVGERGAINAICKKMYMAHAADPYGVRKVLVYSRPYLCGPEGKNLMVGGCEAMEKWYMEFMDRNLFALGAVYSGAKKGRAGGTDAAGHDQLDSGFAEHSNRCTKRMFKGSPFFKSAHTTKHGITIDFNGCTVNPDKDIITPDEQRKGGLFGSHMSDNLLAKHFQYCGVPFVAGISGSLPQYLMFAMGSKKKTEWMVKESKTWKDALNDMELMAMVGMLELAGFHSVTELMFAVNYYRGKHLVKPPFDGGSFSSDGSDNLEIICHDEKNCCDKAKMMSNTHEKDTTAYEKMMKQFEDAVEKGSFSPQVVDKAVDQASPAAAGPAAGAAAPGNAGAGSGGSA